MANSINATSTGNGGIITTGDDSGVLNIQTNETTAVSIDASQNATFTNGANLPNTFGFKNRIINGNMAIDQRNAGASSNPSTDGGYWTVDRWRTFRSQANKYTIQQNAGSVTPPAGFGFYMGVTSSSAYSILSTDYFLLNTRIEGFNWVDMNWGTASASAATLSFWVRSSLTGTFGGSITNGAETYSYPFTYTVNSANTWEYKTVAIPGPTAGTWVGATNGIGVSVWLGLGAGSTYSGSAGSWSANNYLSATGATSVVGTNGATFYVTGVQLEKGTQATSFDFRSYGTELALCQRYYYRLKAGSSYANAGVGRAYSTANGQAVVAMPVSMRAAPTGGYSALSDWNAAQASGNITALSPAAQYSLDYRQMTIDVTATMTSGQSVILNANNTTNAWIDWSAEL